MLTTDPLAVRRWFSDAKMETATLMVCVPFPWKPEAHADSEYFRRYCVDQTVAWAADAIRRELCARYGIEYQQESADG